MKLFSILILALSFSAQASNYCESSEVKGVLSAGDDCRPIVQTSKIETFQKVCGGVLMNAFYCQVFMIAVPEGSMMNITCVDSESKEALNQDMESEIINYKQSAVITSVAGEGRLMIDEKTYTLATSPAVSVLFDGDKTTMTLNLENKVDLTNVICK